MTTKLNATFLYAQTENDVVMVGFADDQYDTKEYVLLQRSLICDEQDKQLGHDQVHIAYSNPERSTYGGIETFVLKKDSAEIFLSANTATTLETDTHIKIMFPENQSTLANVEKHLIELFSNKNIFKSEN